VKTCERSNSADTKVSEGGGGGGAPGTGAEILLWPVEKTMARQAVPLQPMDVHGGAGGCPEEAVNPWEDYVGAGSWQDLRTQGERSPHWNRIAGRTCAFAKDPRWNILFLKDGKVPCWSSL